LQRRGILDLSEAMREVGKGTGTLKFLHPTAGKFNPTWDKKVGTGWISVKGSSGAGSEQSQRRRVGLPKLG